MIQINERRFRDEGGCFSAAKEFLSKKGLCVCVCKETAFLCGRKRGSAKEMLLDCV